MSWLLAAEGAGSIGAAGYILELHCLNRAGQACLASRRLESVLGRSAGVLFCCAMSGKGACALAIHHATVGQLNDSGRHCL